MNQFVKAADCILVCVGYPFSSYGEVVACGLQDIAIVALIIRFK